MMELSVGFKKAQLTSPRKLFIYSNYKVGKTELTSGLEDYVSLDLEKSSSFYDGNYIDVASYAESKGISTLAALNEAYTLLAKEVEKRGKKFSYLVVDTATALENVAKELAAIEYRKSPLGSKWKGDDVTELAHGAGYALLTKAYQKLYDTCLLFGDRLILFGHLKNSSITKEGKELAAADVNLTGKLKHLVCADADAIGYMYRKEANQNFISFKKMSETDIVTGTRCAHLANQEFCISEKLPDGSLKTNWDKIYIDKTNN